MKKYKLVAILLSLLFGFLGLDRFYLGYWWLGILKLITLGGFGIWWLFDFIFIYTDNLLDKKGNKLAK